MDINEFTGRVVGTYFEDVKPHIDSGDYQLAHIAMGSLNMALNMRRGEIVKRVHCGTALVIHSTLLEEKLGREDVHGIKFFQRGFETYAAQTRLPAA